MAHQVPQPPSPSQYFEIISNHFLVLEYEWDAAFEEYWRQRPIDLRRRALARTRFRRAYSHLKSLFRGQDMLPAASDDSAMTESVDGSEAPTIIDLTASDDDDDEMTSPVPEVSKATPDPLDIRSQLAAGTFLDLTIDEDRVDGDEPRRHPERAQQVQQAFRTATIEESLNDTSELSSQSQVVLMENGLRCRLRSLQQQIDTLSKRTLHLEERESMSTCKICMEVAPEDVRKVCEPCGHWYCTDCIDKWYTSSQRCPGCRGKIEHLLRLI